MDTNTSSERIKPQPGPSLTPSLLHSKDDYKATYLSLTHFTMKNISLIVSLAIAVVTIADPSQLEERQLPACVGKICALHSPIVLRAPFSTFDPHVTATLFGRTFVVGATVTANVATTIGTTCSPGGCSCASVTTQVPSTISISTTTGGSATVILPPPPLPPITTIVVPVPSVRITGSIPIPHASLLDVGVSTLHRCYRMSDPDLYFP